MTNNIYAMFYDDPIEANMAMFKNHLAIALIAMLKRNGWNQKAASKVLKISQPRVSNLYCGRLEKFSIDKLFELLAIVGYEINVSVSPLNIEEPFSLTVKKKQEESLI
jgi:predicted XRE-type DNA-binding protein